MLSYINLEQKAQAEQLEPPQNTPSFFIFIFKKA